MKCHRHSEVIIEQRTAGGTGREGGTNMTASKQEIKKEIIVKWEIQFIQDSVVTSYWQSILPDLFP